MDEERLRRREEARRYYEAVCAEDYDEEDAIVEVLMEYGLLAEEVSIPLPLPLPPFLHLRLFLPSLPTPRHSPSHSYLHARRPHAGSRLQREKGRAEHRGTPPLAQTPPSRSGTRSTWTSPPPTPCGLPTPDRGETFDANSACRTTSFSSSWRPCARGFQTPWTQHVAETSRSPSSCLASYEYLGATPTSTSSRS